MIRRQRNLVRADEQDPVPASVHDGVVADDGGLAAEAVGDDAVLACPGHVHARDLEPYTWIRRGERWGRRAVGRAEKARDDPVGADILNRTGVNGQRRVDAIDAVLAGIADRGIGDGQPEVRLGGGAVRTTVERDTAVRVVDHCVLDLAGTTVASGVAGDDQATPVAGLWVARGDQDGWARNGGGIGDGYR